MAPIEQSDRTFYTQLMQDFYQSALSALESTCKCALSLTKLSTDAFCTGNRPNAEEKLIF